MPYWSARRARRNPGPPTRAGRRRRPCRRAFETRFRRADGTEIDVQVYEAPLIDAAGRASRLDGLGHRHHRGQGRPPGWRAAQDESLARTGRLVTLGEMASTLAHELNQPLSRHRQLCRRRAEPDRPGRSRTRALLTAAWKSWRVRPAAPGRSSAGIQDFVKKREPQFAPVRSGRGGARRRWAFWPPTRAKRGSACQRDRAAELAAGAGRPHPDRTGADQPDPQRHGGDGRPARATATT